MRYAVWILPIALFLSCGGGSGAVVGHDVTPSDVVTIDEAVQIPDVAVEVVSDATELGEDLIIPDAECTKNEDCADKFSDLSPCERAQCIGGECSRVIAEDHTPCEDGDLCTSGETCLLGQCQGGVSVECDDNNECTLDICKPAEGCVNTPLEGPCAQDDKCVLSGVCVEGKCVKQMIDCNDNEPCTIDSCNPAIGCIHEKLLSGDCDDANACTVDTQCVDGVCKGKKIDCNDYNVCTQDLCDPLQGCKHNPIVGSKCDDGKSCTIKDKCNEKGECVGISVDCDDGDPCTDDFCTEGKGCEHINNNAPCNDFNECTEPDMCHDGICSGTPKICNTPPQNECKDDYTMITYSQQGACVSGGICEYLKQEVPCPEGCEGGLCKGDPCQNVSCDTPPNECFNSPGTCQNGKCFFTYADGKACEDGNPCTDLDTCNQGLCMGVAIVCNKPPASVCEDAFHVRKFLKSGTCEPDQGCVYDSTLVACISGCEEGFCIESLDLIQADFSGGGLVGMGAETTIGACVIPGWVSGTAEGATLHLVAGFEP